MQAIQNATDIGAAILVTVVREFVGAVQAAYGDSAVATDGTIPDLLRNHVINRTRWLWLIEFPQMKAMQTPEREKLNASAEEVLKAIASREMNVESPTAATSSGNWNSENKLIMRTHPIPRPGIQGSTNANDYANPDGPTDSTEES